MSIYLYPLTLLVLLAVWKERPKNGLRLLESYPSMYDCQGTDLVVEVGSVSSSGHIALCAIKAVTPRAIASQE